MTTTPSDVIPCDLSPSPRLAGCVRNELHGKKGGDTQAGVGRRRGGACLSAREMRARGVYGWLAGWPAQKKKAAAASIHSHTHASPP
ncbi:hypothetical protein EON67_10810 [archaeon]|nr:MAG: hypothetical protein EON67_10810 [archaeon]